MDPSKKAIVVKDMRSLQREKARLRRLCHAMEAEAEERVAHVKKHYGAMAFNSLFPHVDTQVGIAKMLGQMAKGAFKSSSFKSGIVMGLITLVEFIGVRKITELVQQLFKKKPDKEEAEKEMD